MARGYRRLNEVTIEHSRPPGAEESAVERCRWRQSHLQLTMKLLDVQYSTLVPDQQASSREVRAHGQCSRESSTQDLLRVLLLALDVEYQHEGLVYLGNSSFSQPELVYTSYFQDMYAIEKHRYPETYFLQPLARDVQVLAFQSRQLAPKKVRAEFVLSLDVQIRHEVSVRHCARQQDVSEIDFSSNELDESIELENKSSEGERTVTKTTLTLLPGEDNFLQHLNLRLGDCQFDFLSANLSGLLQQGNPE